MKIRLVNESDKAFWMSIDLHINENGFANKVFTKTGYIICTEQDVPVGLLTFNILWENMPFVNFLYIMKAYRNRGYATYAMNAWENEMKQQGYKVLLISTQVNETAQMLYRKLGYIDCGSLIMHDTPYDQPMEMFMRKVIQ